MASSILGSIMSVLNSHEISNLSSRLGEPEQAVSSGVISSVATIISGMTKKADDSSFMRQILELVSAAPADPNVSSLASEALSPGGGSAAVTPIMDAGRKLLLMIFGSNQNEVNDLVARASGMSGGALRQLTALVAPLFLSV